MIHLIRIIAISFVLMTPVFAQKLVDPAMVAPEYRDAAEHRRAEQLKQRACGLKAEQAKIVLRDRAAFVLKCMDAADASR
ncbi:hypothetical protein [Bradyrhizobium iriomotense]|uniref:Uncharacterized protein n=1 Tax=Bradyrhizobium iriomotense TaxID=441950 RepID=A0ABQ6BGW0_9BRAD|nr:hypothetical protein [Bradyrhizobium iriomotense]GLR91343.1 hypothetical protein GCM10007857_80600 [Bradyrhizobium iriomotense]